VRAGHHRELAGSLRSTRPGRHRYRLGIGRIGHIGGGGGGGWSMDAVRRGVAASSVTQRRLRTGEKVNPT